VTGVGSGGTTTPPTTPPASNSPSPAPPTETAPSPQSPTPTPPASTPPASSGCSAMYNTTGAWGNGFQGEVMVHAGTTAVNGWTVSFTLPGNQTVSQVWSGKSTTSGSLVTVKNESWNGSISPGNYTTFGLLGSGTAPTALQNLTCTSP